MFSIRNYYISLCFAKLANFTNTETVVHNYMKQEIRKTNNNQHPSDAPELIRGGMVGAAIFTDSRVPKN
ncbi:MAG: hypothetical protein LAKADJCE_00155 [Candidatus Argoarchaeum ethanivorans]|uniref:Uncharacterized protein n=1 Tax=Candidatus Argoarchaeum ethanivorans TaxID=2608793 RepID=A0A811T5S3_9EURY|nr:MAG: hypothetical protein LAKADJCE_00155 [Candidatus Argoarchaeum ethanivorans]